MSVLTLFCGHLRRVRQLGWGSLDLCRALGSCLPPWWCRGSPWGAQRQHPLWGRSRLPPFPRGGSQDDSCRWSAEKRIQLCLQSLVKQTLCKSNISCIKAGFSTPTFTDTSPINDQVVCCLFCNFGSQILTDFYPTYITFLRFYKIHSTARTTDFFTRTQNVRFPSRIRYSIVYYITKITLVIKEFWYEGDMSFT